MVEQRRLTIRQAIECGVAHHNAGRLREAEKIYTQILRSDPNQPEAAHLLGIVAHQAGKHDVAIALVGKALAVRPDFAEAHFNLGIMLHEQGKLDDALASYRKALAVQPDHAEAHYNLGVVLQAQGKLDDAVASYHEALAVRPDYAEAHNSLGNALQKQGRMDDAVASCRKALAIRPDCAEAHHNLGAVFHEQGMLDDALASYRKALAIEPDCAEVHYNLAQALQKQGKLDDAVTGYRKALAIRPDYAEAHVGLGLCCHYRGQLAEARKAYTSAIALNPEPGIAHVGLRRIRLDEKEIPDPAADVPDDRQACETAFPGLRVWNRPVEKPLVDLLYRLPVMTPQEQMQSSLNKDRYSSGIRQGNMNIADIRDLFALDEPVIRELRDDITSSLSSLLHADIYICDSFFNIYHADSWVVPHNHINAQIDEPLGFQSQKYSLVYYVDTGDKTAEDPGTLTFHDPDYSVDPEDGDIVLFPSSAMHSTSYSGEADRIIVGVNFYTI